MPPSALFVYPMVKKVSNSSKNKSKKKTDTKTKNIKAKSSQKKSTQKKSTKKKQGKNTKKKPTAKKQKHWQIPKQLQFFLLMSGLLISTVVGVYYLGLFPQKRNIQKPEVQEALLSQNEYSRSGIPLKEVKALVVHYVSNPGSSAMENRNYFEGLKENHATKASSHYIIGLEGEIVQCIPLDEMSYASNNRNTDTISIECCHPEEDGKFTTETYESLVKLLSWLCVIYDLSERDIIRHYDVTGKTCPLYYVKHEEAWKELLQNVGKELHD